MLCTRLCTLVHITGSLIIIWRGNNWKKSIQRRILESLFRVISRLQITVVMHTPLQTECWVFFRGQLNLGMLTYGSSQQKSCTPTYWVLYFHMESALREGQRTFRKGAKTIYQVVQGLEIQGIWWKIEDSKVVVIGEKTPSFRFARTFKDGPWALCNSSNVVFQTGWYVCWIGYSWACLEIDQDA